MKRSTSSVLLAAGALVAINLSLAQAGAAGSPVSIVADVALMACGAAMAMTKAAPGGARLRDLNMAVPCPGIAGVCRNYFHPPKGELLVPVILPDGKSGMVCSPDARLLGQGEPERVAVEVREVKQLRGADVVDGVID